MSVSTAERPAFTPFSVQFVLAATLSFLAGFLSLNIAPLIPILLTSEYGLDAGQAGLAVSATLLVHTIFLLPAGILIDRLGVRRSLLIGTVCGALGSVLIAFASSSFPLLILGRMVTGFCTGVAFPTPIRIVAATSSQGSASSNQGLVGAFTFVGSMVAMFLPVPGVLGLGWAPFFLGVAVFCGLVGLLAMVASPDVAATAPSARPSLRATVADPRALALGCVHLASYGLARGIQPWTVTYLQSAFDLPLTTAALFTAIATSGGMFGRSAGGLLARWFSLGRVIVIGLLATLVAIAAFAVAHSFALAVVLLLLLGVVANMPYGPMFGILARSPKGSPASTIAVVVQVGNLAALSLPTVIGYMVAQSGSFTASFFVALALGLAIDAFLLFRSPISGDLRAAGLSGAAAAKRTASRGAGT